MKKIITIIILIFNSLSFILAGDVPAASTPDSLLTDSLVNNELLHDSNHELHSSEIEIAERFISVFEKSPAFIVVLYIIIIYSILTLIILTVVILINRTLLNRDSLLTNELNEKYQELLMDYVFASEENEEAFGSLEKIASDGFRRQILINQLLELSASVQGEMRDKIRNLYLKLNLKKDTLRKAYSKKWHENVKGFRELAFMNVREANDRLLDCLNSPNDILRIEAQISLVRLSDDNPYSFLDHLEKPLALWEQITLHELLVAHNLNTPDFSQWFKLENLSIVIFSLQMVSWFKQKEAMEGVVELLYHEDMNVRNQAIRVCGDLQFEDSLKDLKKIYEEEDYKNKIEILRSFSQTPVDEYLEFLNQVLDMEEDVQLQISATKAMENLGEVGISRLIKLMKSKTEFKNYQIIIRHVLDGRIY